jgi:late competence protein required for DNA uptake (superfamily II DNA/RNA helicase)
MKRHREYSRSKSGNGLLVRLLGYALTTFVIPFVLNIVRNKLAAQQRLLCTRCHGKLEETDPGKFYCKKCKIIKLDRP